VELERKLDSELAMRMSFGSEFQTFGVATQNARLAVSVRVYDTERRGAERRWTAETASSLGAVRRCTAERKSTEPCVMTAILYLIMLDS